DHLHQQPVTKGQKGFRYSNQGGVFPRSPVKPIVLRSGVEIAERTDAQDVRKGLHWRLDSFILQPPGYPNGKLKKGMPQGFEVGAVSGSRRRRSRSRPSNAFRTRGNIAFRASARCRSTRILIS